MCATDGAGKPTHEQPSGDPLGSGPLGNGGNRGLAEMISIGPGVPRGLPNRLAVLLELFAEAAAGMEQQRHTSPQRQGEGIITFVFTCPHTGLVADLGLPNDDDVVALRAAQRIIDLAGQGERDLDRLKAATLAWVAK